MIRFAFLLIILPISLWAEPVTIRTGEHPSFSRFVINIGVGTDWSIEAVSGGYQLSLGRSDGFDLSQVFERIPKDRVSSVVERAPNELFMATDCACLAEAFLWQPSRLVVDIMDGPAPSGIVAVPLGGNNPDEASVLPLDLFSLSFQSVPEMFPVLMPVPANWDVSEAPTNGPFEQTETALLEGVARAAAQGFLDAAVETLPEAINAATEGVTERSEAEPPLYSPSYQQHPGVGISTAIDRELNAISELIAAELETHCFPADFFQLDEWGDIRAFHLQVAELAEALAGEFGEQPREAQEDLARLYLHFGFGTEARVALSADTAQSQERSVLLQLAGLIDEYEGDYSLIASQSECATAGALWAFIAAPKPLETEAANRIMQSFFALPQPLRGQIAPRFSRHLVDVGQSEAASQVLRATDNNDTETTHDTASARALVAEVLIGPAEAISVLAEEAGDNARMTPESLVRLIELEIESTRLPQEENLILAAAMRQEHRNTPIAARLAIAEAAGRAQLGQYQFAIDLLIERDDAETLHALNTAFTTLTENALPTVFLGIVFDELPLGLTPDTENIIAQRLIDLGFPERALTLLAGPATRGAAAERRYLKAMASIETRDFADAIDELLGLSTPRANNLRGRAYSGLGDYRTALSTRPIAGASPEDTSLQFRAGAWASLANEDDPILSAFAETLLKEPTEVSVASLADRRAILAQSRESRRVVEDLLQRFDGTVGQE